MKCTSRRTENAHDSPAPLARHRDRTEGAAELDRERRGLRIAALLACLAAACLTAGLSLLLSSCGEGSSGCSEGADLSSQVSIESTRLVAQSGDSPGGRVDGQVRNGSDRGLEVRLPFAAVDSNGTVFEANDFQTVGAGETASFSAGPFCLQNSSGCRIPLQSPSCPELSGLQFTELKATERFCLSGGTVL
jgi:hypothetical protein